ncbi:flagellar hook-basal body protein [Ruminococcaceae bacterium OttesenSCG-928-L11]|nr:flagellar hook-basal body protein [Ruminococcaceae bacterium OttesenSCG-928-L11]
MVRGFYTAASGMVTQQKKLNNISNNIANVSTTGYKRDILVEGTFGEHVAVRMNAYQYRPTVDIGKGVFMNTIDEDYTVYEQGGIETTYRPMDMAILGNGFFIVANDNGEYLTRDGQFSLDEEGYLVLPGLGRVQGDGGDIQIGTSDFEVDFNGDVFVRAEDEEEATQIGRIILAVPEDYDAMEKAANGMYISTDYSIADAEAPTFMIRQGILERSNVNMAEEMSLMIASQRSLQSCSQLVRMYDELSEQAANRISRVSQG